MTAMMPSGGQEHRRFAAKCNLTGYNQLFKLLCEIMGLQDRDYMRGKSGESGGRGSSLDETLESLLGGFFNRHKGLVKIAVFVLLVLIVAGVLMAVLAD